MNDTSLEKGESEKNAQTLEAVWVLEIVNLCPFAWYV